MGEADEVGRTLLSTSGSMSVCMSLSLRAHAEASDAVASLGARTDGLALLPVASYRRLGHWLLDLDRDLLFVRIQRIFDGACIQEA